MSNQQQTLTVEEAIRSIGLSDWITSRAKCRHELFQWPPDAFAAAAYVLEISGAYLHVARWHDWTGKGKAKDSFWLDSWPAYVDRVAQAWVQSFHPTPDVPSPIVGATMPGEVREILDDIASLRKTKICDLSRPSNDNFDWLPFVKLLCVSDAACGGIGLLYGDMSAVAKIGSGFLLKKLIAALERGKNGGTSELFEPSSLGINVDRSRVVVLPKMRTSQRGVTLRSLSHHLALLTNSDVEAHWNIAFDKKAVNDARRANKAETIAQSAGPYNLLLIPWPYSINPSQFCESASSCDGLAGRPQAGNKFFCFRNKKVTKKQKKEIVDLILTAQQRLGKINGIVFPELAMSLESFYDCFGKNSLPDGIDFVACGLGEAAANGMLGKNFAIVRRRASIGLNKEMFIDFKQDKHHRWAIDRSQSLTYGLLSSLRSGHTWWEAIDLSRRSINFYGS